MGFLILIMKIAIDIDEVITDTTTALVNYYNRNYNGRRLRFDDFTQYHIEDVLGISKKEGEAIFERFFNSGEFDKIIPIEGAINSIRDLARENDISILTARPDSYRGKTENWFDKYLQEFKKRIIYSDDASSNYRTKAEICRNMEIGLILEDHFRYSVECANAGIDVVLFDKPWNKNIKHKRIKRVKNWNEAVWRIEEFGEENEGD